MNNSMGTAGSPLTFALMFLLILSLLAVLPTVHSGGTDQPFSPTPLAKELLPDAGDEGRGLAQKYCQSCHLFPEPELLDKTTWVEGVLPNMGLRLGIRNAAEGPYDGLSAEERQEVQGLGVYPEKPLLSEKEWQQIVTYYKNAAPESPLPQIKVAPVTDRLPFFQPRTGNIEDKPAPKTTLLKFDPAASRLYIGDDQNSVYVLDGQFGGIDHWWVDSAPTDIDFPAGKAPRLLSIGVFPPSDQKKGQLFSLEKKSTATAVHLPNLPRPVQFVAEDMNADGKEDVIICGFGNHAGKLFWYDGFDPEKENLLSALPGSRKVEVRDMNMDGKPDIIALRAQAYEGMSVYYNQGGGKFREKKILEFHPAFGASYFETADFNQDGKLDLLLTNGDNWDYSPVNKNYHGIRIYLNDGKDNFKEAYFYPLYGANKAVARDFDGDGDLDIAATSFYSDLAHPEQSFLYLSNEGKLAFTGYSTPEAAQGKWLTMEAADFDGDGDVDIVLGSYFQSVAEMAQLVSQGVTDFPQLLILTNTRK